MQKRKFDKTQLLYFLPAPVITVLIMLIVYSLKGIYPFGDGSVVIIDLGQSEFPSYMHLYDVLHGNGSLFYDMTTAGGLEYNVVGKMFDPFLLMMYFVRRSYLGNFLSFYIIIKFASIALTSAYALKSLFSKLPWYWVSVFSLIYAFCGYNLEYYSNAEWLTIVAALPLIVLFAVRMFNGGKAYPFMLMLALCLAVNTYLSVMMLVFIAVSGFLYITLIADRSKRGINALKLGTSAVAAVAVSFFSVFPWINTTFLSQRFSNTAQGSLLDSYFSDFDAVYLYHANKLFLFMGLEFAMVSFLLLLTRFRKDKRKVSFFFILIVLFVLQVAFESVNLIWHGGSYERFPVRNGFMFIFIFVCAGAYYIEQYDAGREKGYKNKWINYASAGISVFLFLLVLPQLTVFENMLIKYGVESCSSAKIIIESISYSSLTVIGACVISFFIFNLNKNKTIRTVLSVTLVVTTLFMNCYGFIGISADDKNETSRLTYINDSFMLHDTVSNSDVFSRVCNEDVSLNTNYPYLVNRAALSNWRHTLTGEQRSNFGNLGFSLVYTRVLDTGGTLFSKGILRVDNTITKRELPDSLYNLASTCGEYNYYNNKYTIPLGITVGSSAFDNEFNNNTFEYQNSFYNSMGYEGELFSKADFELESYTSKESPDGKHQITTYCFNVGNKSELYFLLNDDVDILKSYSFGSTCSIKINGEDYLVPENDFPENKSFRVNFNNNVLDLGTYENENVYVEITSNVFLDDIAQFYFMDMNKMEQLSQMPSGVIEYSTDVTKNTVDLTMNGEKGKYLFLPVDNEAGWTCTVNGESTEIKNVLGTFMAIELKDGVNVIHLSYKSTIALASIAVSVGCSVIILALWLIFRKKKPELKLAGGAAYILLAVSFSAFVLFVYVIPIGYKIYKMFI